jgi:acetyltransferase
MTARLGAALEAVLASRAAARGRIADLRGGDDDDAITLPAAPAREKEREVVERIRAGRGPDVLVVDRPSATLRRALRDHPVGLLVVVGTIAAADVEALDADLEQPWLGPDARLGVGPGRTIAIGHAAGELTGLTRALGREAIRLAIAPTPAWLPSWLAEPALSGMGILGTVGARALSIAWAEWAAHAGAADVVVPVGVPEAPLDQPRAAALDVVVAAHALERRTGPVFPSPRVIAIVHAQLAGLRGRDDGDSTGAEVWAQARRALPMTGAIVGMESPRAGLPTDAPTAAFLAQRVLLREASHRALLQAAPAAPSPPAEDGIGRAAEILHNAGEALSDQETKVVLRGFGMQVTRQAVANSASGASGYAERIGFPVVLKALSPDLRRRSELGAIELDLPNAAAVRRAYAAIVDAVERRAPTARLDGVVVAEHVPAGLDVHAGVVRLRGGRLAVFAQPHSGTHPSEPLLALAPLSHDAALSMAHAVLSRIPVPALRRDSDPGPSPLADALLRLSWLAERFADRIHLVDLNPVRITADARGYVILDAHLKQRAHLEGR